MFQYVLHYMLFSNKEINRKNLIHESTTWFNDNLYLNSPLHHVVHILTSWEQDDT